MATDNTGTANSPYDAVVTETIGGEIQAAPLNTGIGNLETAVESHTHPLDSSVGWDSMKSSFRPPDTGDSTNRWRLVSGADDITISGGSNDSNGSVLFATDATQGNPAFTTMPDITACIYTSSEVYGYVVQLTGVTSTSFNYDVFEMNGGTHGGSLSVRWYAYGKVA